MTGRFAKTILAVFALCVASSVAWAHDPQLSGIRIVIGDGKTIVSATTHRSQLDAAEGRRLKTGDLDAALQRRVRVRFGGRAFVPETTTVLRDDANDLVTWQATRSGVPDGDPEVLARIYPDDPGSRTVVDVARDGIVVQETLLDAANPALRTTRAPWWAVPLRFLREGVLHIFGGPDHIAFVLGLLLLGGNLKSLLKTVTAFTLAHSVTLTIAATGLWTPSSRIIEPLIALSIVAIAVENWNGPSGQDRRPWFAFGFGLIHGFGFAGALREVGLPQSALGVALAAFNIGVECGQAMIVLAVAPILAGLARRRPIVHARVVRLAALAIGAAGLFWLVTRLRAV